MPACRIMLILSDPVAEAGGDPHDDPNPDQRVRVFVSSTLQELAAERQAAAAAITQECRYGRQRRAERSPGRSP
jgi:hypothetical protein